MKTQSATGGEISLAELEQKYQITLEAIPEDCRVRGNCSAIDEETDKACEDEIFARLESGDVWAWFTAKVTAKDSNGREASDCLGCCCYEDAEDFKRGGYYEDMVRQCVEELESPIVEQWGESLDNSFPADCP